MASTDEVWRLQGASDEDALMFQSIAKKGHYRMIQHFPLLGHQEHAPLTISSIQ